MTPSRVPAPFRTAAAPAVMLLLFVPGPVKAQVIHRPTCHSVDCDTSALVEQLDSMVYREGPWANDRDDGSLRAMRVRVRDSLDAAPNDARLWLALSEIEAGLGDLTPAIAAARRALETGADSALALRAEAAARLRRPGQEEEGAQEYFEAASHLSPASVERFYGDMAPLLTPVEVEWWASADREARAAWLREFWSHRAALAGVAPALRLAEHMRRLSYAADHFESVGTGSGAPVETEILWRSEYRRLAYDDRGLVYVRRGPPADVLRNPSTPLSHLPDETWLYVRADGTVDAFYFAKSLNGGSDYRAVIPPTCGDGSSLLDAAVRVSDVSTEAGWVLNQPVETARLNSRTIGYCLSGDRFTRAARSAASDMTMRQASLEALRVESPRPAFSDPIDAVFDFYTFRGTGGRTDVVTALAVPLKPDAGDTLRITTTLADQTGGVVRMRSASASRTVAIAPLLAFGPDEAWGFAYVTPSAEPSPDVEFRVLVEDPSQEGRGGLWGGTTEIPSYRGENLMLSDVVVSGSGPATFTRGDVSFPLHPGRTYTPGAGLVLYYEIYNVAPGTEYRTEISIRRQDQGIARRLWSALTGASEFRLAFSTRAAEDSGGELRELRSLRADLEPGTYTLDVRVTDAAGRRTNRSREIVIEPAGTPARQLVPGNRSEETS